MEGSSDALNNLRKLKHIVVVMMENRSFDQMLGYLGRDWNADVRGLQGKHCNVGPDGRPHDSFELRPTDHKFQRAGEPLQKRLDPCHSPECVAEQLSNGSTGEPNGGFVDNYVRSREEDDELSPEEHRIPMGYYSGESLPLYDHLAKEYCVIDAWHSSVPGDTWPNRLHAVAGREGPKVRWWEGSDLLDRLTHLPFVDRLRGAPIYDVEAFTRQLDRDQWRWYSHDPSSLRAVDSLYRDFKNPMASNFGFFDRKKVSFITEALEGHIVGDDSFLGDAAHNRLPQVSWIDPNFWDVSVLDPHSNDDHPPSDILAGQAFVLDVYNALRTTPDWDDTLLVITYDEHGGFYDHVPPPAISDNEHQTLGLRVPVLVAGPRVKQFVCHEFEDEGPWDHTALIRSILLAFAENPEQAINDMGDRHAPRVRDRKAHLGFVLEPEPRTNIAPPTTAESEIESWRARARVDRLAAGPKEPSVSPDGAGQPLVLTGFQDEWAQFAIAMRSAGLPPGP